ncbi:MAG: hypothetical protein ACR2L2_07345 [Acidobacteriota bacterium]
MRKRSVGSVLLLLSCALITLTAARNSPDQAGVSLAVLNDIATGPKPAIYLRTDKTAYTPGENLTLTVTIDASGVLQPKTFFLYRINQQTGEVRYINTAGGLLPAGTITDLFGNSSNFPSYNVPTVSNVNLFGASGFTGAALAVPAGQTGTYQFVFEFRDVTGQRVFARSNTLYAHVEAIDVVTGNITASRTFSSNRAYALSGAVFVKTGATLTIEPGTFVYGDTASQGTLVVEQGAKIVAAGTPGRPIILSSGQPVGSRRRGDWGGLIISGRAPLNVPGGTAIGEGGTGTYGGTDPNDSSGVLRYVRVEFAGIRFSPDNELNGIAFQAVGKGDRRRVLPGALQSGRQFRVFRRHRRRSLSAFDIFRR